MDLGWIGDSRRRVPPSQDAQRSCRFCFWTLDDWARDGMEHGRRRFVSSEYVRLVHARISLV